MKLRRYKVVRYKNNQTDQITKFEVADYADDDPQFREDRPAAAVFPVSMLHPVEVQRERATQFAEYMNEIIEATEKAYRNKRLIDKIKGPGESDNATP